MKTRYLFFALLLNLSVSAQQSKPGLKHVSPLRNTFKPVHREWLPQQRVAILDTCLMDSAYYKIYKTALSNLFAFKYYFYYDAARNNTNTVIYAMDSTLNNWKKTSMTTFTYNSSKVIGATSFSWDGVAWNNSSLNTYSYNSNSDLISEVYQTWNGSQWANSSRIDYTLSVSQSPYIELYRNWNSGTLSWDNFALQQYHYNAVGENTLYTQQHWFSGNWKNSYKQEKIYDTNHNCTWQAELVWNTNTSTWDSTNVDINTYNGNNQPLVTTIKFWNGNLNVWQNDQRTTYSYTGQNLTYVLHEAWNIGTSQWKNFANETAVYNSYDYWTVHDSQLWDNNSNTWINWADERVYYTCSQLPDGILEQIVFKKGFTVYPNPASDVLKIDNDLHLVLVKVYAVSGQIVSETFGQTEVSVKNLRCGFYTIELFDEKGRSIGRSKFLKE